MKGVLGAEDVVVASVEEVVEIWIAEVVLSVVAGGVEISVKEDVVKVITSNFVIEKVDKETAVDVFEERGTAEVLITVAKAVVEPLAEVAETLSLVRLLILQGPPKVIGAHRASPFKRTNESEYRILAIAGCLG